MDFGVVNVTAPTVNATCNWYGSTNPTTVASKIFGPVTYTPYRTDGIDGSGSTGFQPTSACATCTINITSITITNVSCTGRTDGSAKANVSGAVGTVSYLWSDGQTTQTAVGLTDGPTYSVTVTDVNGCTDAENNIVIGANPTPTWYTDADGDGYGNGASVVQCDRPTDGFLAGELTATSGDCDDTDPDVHPGAEDVCNGIDDNCDNVIDENAISATVVPGGTVTYCHGVDVLLSANNDPGTFYQWYKGVNPIAGETNSTLHTTKKGDFYVVENKGTCSATSATTTVARLPAPPAFITTNGSLELCSPNNTSITMRATGNPTSPYAYQWKKGGIPIGGATNRLFTTTSTGSYTVTITNTSPCSTTSAPVIVTSCKVGETEDVILDSRLDIYPNPSNGQFVIELEMPDDVTGTADIQLMNTLGQSVYLDRTTIENGNLRQEVRFDNTIAAGTYFVRVIVGDKVFTGQIVYQQ